MSSDPTTEYAQKIVDGEIASCRYVKLACQRHLNDLKRDDWDYVFKPELADRFFRFCKYLRHYKGEKSGERFELMEWQKFVYGNLYGWVDQDDNFRFKYSYLEVPRKNGKSFMASAIACFDSALLDREGTEVYCLATKEDQAKIVINDARNVIKHSPEVNNIFEMLVGRSTLFIKDSNRTSFIKPLASDSRNLDGLNPVTAICDELHQWRKRELWDVMEDAFGARRNWHMIAITTAGYDKTGVCYQEREHLVKILEGQIECDDKFGVIYTVDKEDFENWSEPRVWEIANPSLYQAKEIDFMHSQVQKVKQVPTRLNSFLNKQLNIWTDTDEAWLNFQDWEACRGEINIDNLIGKECYAGMDLARVSDFSACAYYFPVQDGLQKSHVICDFFLPDYEIDIRSIKDQVPYQLWADDGNLILTNGKTTNWDFLKDSILQRNGQFKIKGFGYDRHFAGELVQALERENVEMRKFGMGFYSMANPTAELERQIIAQELVHEGCPILNWNISNVVVSRDPAGNMKPDKMRAKQKIDGAVACIIALGVSMRDEEKEEEKINPYEDRGLRVI